MEQLANFLASTTLNMPGDLDATTTTLTLTSTASPFPSAFPFRIRIDNELMAVTATPGTNQWTVTRGDGGTTAATHVDGSTVRAVLTKESLDTIITIQQAGTEIANRRKINFIGATVSDNSGSERADVTISGYVSEEADRVDPTGVSFSWVSQSTAAITTNSTNKSILIDMPNPNSGVSYHAAIVATPGGSTFTWIVKFASNTLDMDSAWPAIGVRNSGNSNVVAVALAYSSHTYGFYVQHINEGSPGSQSTASGPYFPGGTPWRWMKFTGDGTTLKIFLSTNGINWIQMYSETLASYLSAVTHVALVLNPNANANYRTGILISSFSLS